MGTSYNISRLYFLKVHTLFDFSLSSAGAGIYVQHSYYISNSSVFNNTALGSINSYNSRVSFYCLSNTTSADVRSSVLYSGGRIFAGSTNSYLEVYEASTTGLLVYIKTPRGIYKCEIADSNGNIINLNIGVYYSYSSLGMCIIICIQCK